MWQLEVAREGCLLRPPPPWGMRASEALLGAMLLLFFSSGFMETSKYLYSEVVVPRALRWQTGLHTQKEMSYLIRTEGINRIVHLQQQSFIIRSIPVYYFSMKGDRRVEHPYIRDDCYYSGYVESVQESEAVLSTCAGLRGYIQVGSLKYEIRPIENSSAFQHLIYRMAPEQREACRGVLEDRGEQGSNGTEWRPWAADSTATESARRAAEYHGAGALIFRYLEYYAVCDQSMYRWEKSNETQVMMRILQIVSILHNIYDDIGLHVVLVGMELWTEQDYSTISKTLDKTLEEFYSYAAVTLQHQVHFDHACVFTLKGEDRISGKSWQDRFCLYNHVSVSAVKVSSSLMKDGVSAAHELGHAIGFVHDDLLGQESGPCDCNCTATPGHCVMHSTAAECLRLSNCSRSVYDKFLQRPGTTCLLNIPSAIFETKMCGNAIVEGNEECDCGKTEQDCRRSGCCQKNCTLKPGIDCLHGACCEACQFVPEGRLCREAGSACDLPEYCTGSSADCPPDVYKQDGMPCGTQDHCYRGECRSLYQHCRNLFGPGANRAPLSCYKELNMRGDRTGNCGQEKLGYKKCREEDVLCGRLQCTNIKIIPVILTGQAIVQTPMGNVLCWGTEFHGGEHAYDIGAIRDGSTCGAGKICINRTCVGLEVLSFDCNFSKCNNQGICTLSLPDADLRSTWEGWSVPCNKGECSLATVCNNNKNCHCTYGWAPPNCSGRGHGGSVDSGPPPEDRGSKHYILLGCGVGVAFVFIVIIARLKRQLPAGWWGRTLHHVDPDPTRGRPDCQPEPSTWGQQHGAGESCVAGPIREKASPSGPAPEDAQQPTEEESPDRPVEDAAAQEQFGRETGRGGGISIL